MSHHINPQVRTLNCWCQGWTLQPFAFYTNALPTELQWFPLQIPKMVQASRAPLPWSIKLQQQEWILCPINCTSTTTCNIATFQFAPLYSNANSWPKSRHLPFCYPVAKVHLVLGMLGSKVRDPIHNSRWISSVFSQLCLILPTARGVKCWFPWHRISQRPRARYLYHR